MGLLITDRQLKATELLHFCAVAAKGVESSGSRPGWVGYLVALSQLDASTDAGQSTATTRVQTAVSWDVKLSQQL
ncbi:uncharacterized protein BCR38DRAFT_29912 [Pseudomassariella vexata]|uniref:Uncharacterized protein n=1 Tax=Pseudomassariella vexata TaxID=1141098 RepID=A0A1Y2DPU0_9PEZI|nr:uncharacterized protein BCR38DRAFT_29912 [Pseudomassariella vexata]ORY61227.1 hypothetical protein BCR38DRAFT_29912 [Pseudomassariella vexata]